LERLDMALLGSDTVEPPTPTDLTSYLRSVAYAEQQAANYILASQQELYTPLVAPLDHLAYSGFYPSLPQTPYPNPEMIPYQMAPFYSSYAGYPAHCMDSASVRSF
jgi:hypothetical protein